MSKPLDDAWAWLKAQANTNAPVLAILAFLLLFGGAWGRQALEEKVAQELQPIIKKQDRYEQDIHEFAKDVRELYRVSPYVRRSERLERPFPDHSTDGGE